MDEKELYKLKSYIERSKNRTKILELLKEKGEPMTPSQIAKELGVQRPTISQRITGMADQNLVKVLNPEDNMNRYYKLTKKGEEIVESLN